MARLAFGGFDFGHVHADGLTNPFTGTGWNAALTYDTTTTRSGGRSAKIAVPNTNLGASAVASVFTASAGVTFLARCWVYLTAYPGAAFDIGRAVSGGSAIGVLALQTDGTLQHQNNSGTVKATTGPLTLNAWHCLEFSARSYGVSGTAANQGTWTAARLDGVQFASETQTNSGATLVSEFRWGIVGSVVFPAAGFTVYLDDWAINDSTGAADTSWPGTTEKIVLLLPSGDNAVGANWKLGNNTSPSSNAYDSVNNVPPTGKALASGAAGDQLRNAVAPTSVAADEATVNLQSYTTAGVPSGSPINAVYALAEIATSSTTTKTLGVSTTTNPTISETTGSTAAAAASTYPTNWTRLAQAITTTPTVTLGNQPALKVRLASGISADSALVSAAGLYVAYGPAAPPTISLTAPTTGSLVAGTVTLTASVGGGSGGITQVEFLVDGSVVNTDTGSPYTFALDTTTLTDGSHSLTARATDGAAQTTTSSAVTITVDNTGPTVAITSPATGTSVTGTFAVTATASDAHTVDHVELLVDGTVVGTDASSPYTFTVDAATLAPGSRSLVARAYDSLGNHVDSAAVVVTVPEVTRPILVRERPPLRVSLDVETPSGRRYRWAPDDPRPENIPSGLRWSSTMPGGYESLDTTLPRKPGVDYRDLDRLSTIRVRDAGGGSVGEYRLERTPRVSGDHMAISPSAVGWQAHLDDNKSAREIYIDRDLGGWRGPGTARRLGFAGSFAPSDATVTQDTTLPALETAFDEQGGWSATTKPIGEGWYDAQGIPLGSLYYAWQRNSDVDSADANFVWGALLASDDGGLDVDTTGSLRAAGPSSGTIAATTADRIFAFVHLHYDAAGGTPESQRHFAIYWTCLAAYGNHGLTKRGTEDATNAKGFYASDVVAHAVPKWAPLLVVTAESITPSGFVIPQLAFKDATTAAEIVRGATRYGLQDWAVWDDKTFWWHPRGEHSRNWRARVAPAGLEETGPQVDRLWESVIVQYQDVDGTTRTVGPPGSGANTESADLKDSDPDNPANQLGITRRDLLQMGVGTAASATEVGRRFLEESRQLDTSGRSRHVGHVEDDHGVLFPYHAMRAGDTITFTDAADPSPRRIVRADHSADERACSVDLDAPPEALQALLERLQVVLVPLGF